MLALIFLLLVIVLGVLLKNSWKNNDFTDFHLIDGYFDLHKKIIFLLLSEDSMPFRYFLSI